MTWSHLLSIGCDVTYAITHALGTHLASQNHITIGASALAPRTAAFDYHPDRNLPNFIFKTIYLLCLQDHPERFDVNPGISNVFLLGAVGHFWYHWLRTRPAFLSNWTYND